MDGMTVEFHSQTVSFNGIDVEQEHHGGRVGRLGMAWEFEG